VIMMMKVINANLSMGVPMTEQYAKNFMANNNNNGNLLIHIGIIDKENQMQLLQRITLTRTLTKSILQHKRVLRKLII
jgi:hypothetical protein